MPDVTYCVVVPFTRDEEGNITPGEAREAPNTESAKRRAQALFAAAGNVEAIAFSRTGDPASGEFADVVIIASFGEVEENALSA